MSDKVKTIPTKEAPSKKWYVVRAISGQEKKVKQYIEVEINRLNLKDYVSQVLIPTEKIYQIRNGKKISKERSFYPGYVLIEAVLVGEIPHIIKNLPGVIVLGAPIGRVKSANTSKSYCVPNAVTVKLEVSFPITFTLSPGCHS